MASSSSLVIVVTGAATGFGRLAAQTLARAGHIVYGGFLHSSDKDSEPFGEAATFSKEHNVQLHGIQLDVTSDSIIEQAVDTIISEQGRVDVVVHNAGHMNFGPTDAFTPEQFMTLYEVNCIGCHRLNLAILPHMRRAHSGLLIWVSSSSAHGPSSPFLGPYFAAKAAQDSLAQTLSLEISPFGIETSIVVPGIFTKGTAHFSSAMGPASTDIADQYTSGPLAGWPEQCLSGSANMVRDDADPQWVADAILRIVAAPRGKRPFRVHVEAEKGGKMAETVNNVRDLVRERYLRSMGCEELMEVKL